MIASGRTALASSGRISGSGLASARISGFGRHLLEHFGLQHARGGQAEEYVGARNNVGQRSRFGVPGIARLVVVHLLLAAAVDHALDVGDPGCFPSTTRGSPADRGRRAPPRLHPSTPASPCAMSLPTTFSPLSTAAPTMIAVPCWSSWNTGIFIRSRSLLLDVEAFRRLDVFEVDAAERGLEAAMISTSLSGSRSLISMSKHVDAGEFLEQHALAFHHRLARRADRSAPRPSTAVPLVMTPIRLPRAVRLRAVGRIADDFLAGRGDAGRIREREIALVESAAWSAPPRSCPAWAAR